MGKTPLTTVVALAALAGLGLEADGTKIFAKDVHVKWWDLYDPVRHLALILDELGNSADKQAASEIMATLTAVMGEQEYVLPMADAQRMNSLRAQQHVTIAVSNSPTFGAEAVSIFPEAFYRRLDFRLAVAVLPSHALMVEGKRSTQIDPLKLARATTSERMWLIRAYKAVTYGGQVEWVKIGADMFTLDEVAAFVFERARQAARLNDEFVTQLNTSMGALMGRLNGPTAEPQQEVVAAAGT